MMSLSRTGIRRVALSAWLLSHATVVSAGEGPFLWVASGSPDDLAIRTGLALDLPGRPRFGTESTIKVSTSSAAGTVSPPLRMWGEYDLLKRGGAATTLALIANPATGAARAALRQSGALLDNDLGSVSATRTIEAGRRTDGEPAYIARQDLSMAFRALNATLAGGVVMDNKAPLSAELRLEKRLPLGISLKATLSDLAQDPNARLDARIDRRW